MPRLSQYEYFLICGSFHKLRQLVAASYPCLRHLSQFGAFPLVSFSTLRVLNLRQLSHVKQVPQFEAATPIWGFPNLNPSNFRLQPASLRKEGIYVGKVPLARSPSLETHPERQCTNNRRLIKRAICTPRARLTPLLHRARRKA